MEWDAQEGCETLADARSLERLGPGRNRTVEEPNVPSMAKAPQAPTLVAGTAFDHRVQVDEPPLGVPIPQRFYGDSAGCLGLEVVEHFGIGRRHALPSVSARVRGRQR